MEYKIEAIGAQFSKRAIENLGNHFSEQANEGYKLHSLFQAQQPGGCMSSPTITYFAIYVKED